MVLQQQMRGCGWLTVETPGTTAECVTVVPAPVHGVVTAGHGVPDNNNRGVVVSPNEALC